MPCANADTPATQLSQEAAEEAVLCLINEQRAANGVQALTPNQKLRAAARLQAEDAKRIKFIVTSLTRCAIIPKCASSITT